MSPPTSLETPDDMRDALRAYQAEHRALDTELEGIMTGGGAIDLFHVQKIKKKKLWLKDVIRNIRSALIDDIIA